MRRQKTSGKRSTGWFLLAAILLLIFGLTGCGSQQEAGSTEGAPELPGLTFESKTETDYAEGFDIYDYSGGWQLIDVHDAQSGSEVRYLLVPEGETAPEGLPEEMVVLQKPLGHIYLAASAPMALFAAMDGLDPVEFTATQEKDWYVDAASEAMKDGRIRFAGKYSQPDYEMLLDSGCQLAIESTMILHSPSVKEKLESLGIPVFVDQSSYESHPLGRCEWIRLYGAMLDRQEEADAFFEEQKQIIKDLEGVENTGRTVAFFSMNSQGEVVVRASDDYIPKMIDIAGGKYIFQDLKNPNEDSRSAVVQISMEEFYAQASDADYLIYNGSIESPLTSIEALKEKSELFGKFTAVQEGRVWTTDKYLYQATDIMGQLIRDIRIMLTDGSESEMTFLKKVE